MKRLFVIAFAASSLLRPSLVLCMEVTGDVRVELLSAGCCVSKYSSSDVTLRAVLAEDCDGCVDISLSPHSVFSKPSSYAPETATYAIDLSVAPAWDGACASAATYMGIDLSTTLRARVLSSIVIRR